MNSINTITIPLNPNGALELNLYPCDYCNLAWAVYTENEKILRCKDTCSFYEKYLKKTGIKQ